MTTPFALDPRIAAATLELAETTTCLVRMMNDRRYPWIVLVPQRADAIELIDLPVGDRHGLIDAAATIAARMLVEFAGEKMNIAALGNMVRQLHLHVIVRRTDDPAWPDGVWNGSPRQLYEDDVVREAMRERMRGCVLAPL